MENKKSGSKKAIIIIAAVVAVILAAAVAVLLFFNAISAEPESNMTSAEIKQWISDNYSKEEFTKDELKEITSNTTEDDFYAQWKSSLFLAVTKASLDKNAVSQVLDTYTSLYNNVYPSSVRIDDFNNFSIEFSEIASKTDAIKKELGYMPYQTMLTNGDFYVYKKLTSSEFDDVLNAVNTELTEYSTHKQNFYLGSETGGYDDYWQPCPTGQRFIFISVDSTFPEFTDYALTYEYTGKTAKIKDTDGKTYSCKVMRVVGDPNAHNAKTQIVEEINNSFYNAIAKMTTSMVSLKNDKELSDLCTVYNMAFPDGGSMDLTISQANNILSARFSGKYYQDTATLSEIMYPTNEDGSSWVTYDIMSKEINSEFFFGNDDSVSVKTEFLSAHAVFPPANGKYIRVDSGEPVNGYIPDAPASSQSSSGQETVYVQQGNYSSDYSSAYIDPYQMFGNRQVDYYSGSFYRVDVGGSVLNVRTGPGKGYSLQTQLADNTDVAVLGIYNGWAYVQYAFYGYQGFTNNTSTYTVEGWVSADYLDLIPYSP